MDVKEPPRPVHPVVKVLAGILVLCTLVALWVTAAQVKANKIAARYGERIEATPVAPAFTAVSRGRPARIGHFTLALPKADAALVVHDAQDRPLVRFTALRKGQERGWQELNLKILEVKTDEVQVVAEFRPGTPSLGTGTYLALKPGLRVDFSQGRSVTLVSETQVNVEGGGRTEMIKLDGTEQTVLGLKLRLRGAELDLAE